MKYTEPATDLKSSMDRFIELADNLAEYSQII